MNSRRAKIIATIGPSSDSAKMLKELALAGMNVARLNFSHGTHDEHRQRIALIRAISAEIGKPIGILQDLQGPKIRVGTFASGRIKLQAGDKFCLTTRQIEGNEQQAAVSYSEFPKDVHAGDSVLLDDGLINMQVESISGQDVHCRVIFGGLLSDHKGLNLPGSILSVPALTEKDRTDLAFGLEQNVDFVALSFVQKAEDIREIKELISKAGKDTPVIAKIEKPQAVQDIDEIIALADGIMVARGDLGVEVQVEEVPPIQKMIIEHCNIKGKPVITATQMLDSMIHNPRPTRAEAADVANAILDGSDAVMLSGETASGKYPLGAVRVMDKIIHNIENSRPFTAHAHRRRDDGPVSEEFVIGFSAAKAAEMLNAKAIICLTQSGATAKLIARHRPQIPVFALTPNEQTLCRLSVVWGVRGYALHEFHSNFDVAIGDIMELIRAHRIANSGDTVVLTAGLPFARHGLTNMMRIEVIK